MFQTILHKIKRARPREYLDREDLASELPSQEQLMFAHAFDTEEKWNSARVYADRTHQGYGTWTKTIKRYAPIRDNVPLTYPLSDEDVREEEMPFWRRITDPAWVERYVHLLVHLEKDEKTHEVAMRSCNCFFINLFRNFGPRAFEPWKKWVEQWTCHREARYQRVAISLWAAAMTSHNHWPAREAYAIQRWCVEVLDKAIAHTSVEVKPFWDRMVEQFTNSRDIRRYKIFYEYIFDTSRLLQENASLANEFRLSLLRKVLSYGLSWKAPELRRRIIDWILCGSNVLDNDYQMIRSSIGQLLFSTLIWKEKRTVHPSHPFAIDVMEQIFTKYEAMEDQEGKKHLFKTILYSLNKIISFGVSSTWRWLPVLVRFIQNRFEP